MVVNSYLMILTSILKFTKNLTCQGCHGHPQHPTRPLSPHLFHSRAFARAISSVHWFLPLGLGPLDYHGRRVTKVARKRMITPIYDTASKFLPHIIPARPS